MRIELEQARLPVAFMGINADSAVADQDKLTSKCTFALLQELPTVGSWSLLGGGKDDFFIYDRAGHLSAWFPAIGGPNANLLTPDGYARVKGAIMDALAK